MPFAPSDAAQPTQAIPPVPGGPRQPSPATPPPPPPPPASPMPRGADAGGTATYDLSELQQGTTEENGRGPNPRLMRLVLSAGFVALLVIAGGVAFTIGSGSSDDGAGGADFDVALVADEDVDPEPLTVDEVFSESAPTLEGGGAYERVRHEDTDDCASAAQAGFAEALDGNECRQALRAAYVAEDGGQVVTLGVAAFPTAEQARAALEAQEVDSAVWFSALGADEDDEEPGAVGAGGYASSALYGRYIVFSLAAATDDEEAGEEDIEDLEEVSSRFLDVGLAPLGRRAAE